MRRRAPFPYAEIPIHASILLVLAIVFLATLIRSAFGFGEAMIAVPLLALFIPLPVATPLAVLLSVTVAGIVVAQDWRHIHLRSAAGLIVASLFGIPLGLLILTDAHQQAVRAALGVLILLFALYSLFGRNPLLLEQEHRPLLLLTGFIAGILGGAYGMNGPPLVIYGAMRRWSPQHFRATLQAYFLPASALGLIGFWSTGLLTRTVTRDYLLCLPAALPAILIGRAVNRRLTPGVYLKYVYAGLALIGAVLIAEALHHRA
ncbi:MAG: sulfite exporter TauE/SafE family protein [Acidobacteriota bacterium]